jgi:hypothetical protein
MLPDFDVTAFMDRMSSESERASAVLGGALVDAKLQDLFRRKLRCFQDELLEGMGPISTFSARIRLARALDWISEDARMDLDTIRKIRNDFAHSLDHDLSFDEQSVTARCFNLRTSQAFIDGFEIAAVAPNSNVSTETIHTMQAAFKPPRWRYQVAVGFLSQYLDEIGGETPSYGGEDLLSQVRAVSANLRIKVSAVLTFTPPPENAGASGSGISASSTPGPSTATHLKGGHEKMEG